MKDRKVWLLWMIPLILMVAAGLLLVFCLRQRSQPPSDENTALALAGQKLPDFQVTDQSGNQVKSRSFKDRPMLVIEWASWCPYCQKQLPVVQELYEQYGGRIHFVMLNLADPEKESRAQADTYIKKQGFTFPYYYDNGRKAADRLRLDTIPSLYLVDKSQRVCKVIVEVQDKAALERELKQLLDES